MKKVIKPVKRICEVPLHARIQKEINSVYLQKLNARAEPRNTFYNFRDVPENKYPSPYD
jgi:hypothetical protein